MYLTKTQDYRMLLLPGSRYEAELLRWTEERGTTVVSVGGLVEVDEDSIQVTALGWYFVRGVALVFDRYLQADQVRSRFSRII